MRALWVDGRRNMSSTSRNSGPSGPPAELARLILQSLERSPDGLRMAYLFASDVRLEAERLAAASGQARSDVLERRWQDAGLSERDRQRSRLAERPALGCHRQALR